MTAIWLPLEAQQRNPLLSDPRPQFTERNLGLRGIQQRPEPCSAAGITLAKRNPIVPGIPKSRQMQVLQTSRGECVGELPLRHAGFARQWCQTHVYQQVHACISESAHKLFCGTSFISDSEKHHVLQGPHRAIMHLVERGRWRGGPAKVGTHRKTSGGTARRLLPGAWAPKPCENHVFKAARSGR